jgi:hypothetical protein
MPADLERWHAYCSSGQLNADIAKIDPGAPQFTETDMIAFNMGLGIPRYWGAGWGAGW